jgi:hypothetical protein
MHVSKSWKTTEDAQRRRTRHAGSTRKRKGQTPKPVYAEKGSQRQHNLIDQTRPPDSKIPPHRYAAFWARKSWSTFHLPYPLLCKI